jgi:hypothetical protein
MPIPPETGHLTVQWGIPKATASTDWETPTEISDAKLQRSTTLRPQGRAGIEMAAAGLRNQGPTVVVVVVVVVLVLVVVEVDALGAVVFGAVGDGALVCG